MGTGIRVTAHHMSFPVKDLARAREFYEGILGLEEIPRPELFTFPGAWYQAGECEVHLIQTPEGLDVGEPPKALHPMARHSAFAVNDYREAVEHLKSFGLEVLESNEKMGQMWVRDPDGNIIELIAVAR